MRAGVSVRGTPPSVLSGGCVLSDGVPVQWAAMVRHGPSQSHRAVAVSGSQGWNFHIGSWSWSARRGKVEYKIYGTLCK